MSNYDYKNLSYSKDLRDIQIPKFQRSLVWKKHQKIDLLTTLHRDFPFGSLLITPIQGSDKKYNLLDGQQRLSTIKDYDNNKIKYWKELDKQHYLDLFNRFNQILKETDVKPLKQKDFDSLIDNESEVSHWRKDMIEKVKLEDNDEKRIKLYEAFDETILPFINLVSNEVRDYIDLDHLDIPVLEFTGDEVDLPEVYENLNKGGVPLNKYEILSASWFDEKIVIPKNSLHGNEILNLVKNYYNELIQDGTFAISDFSEDDITRTREINLAEFAKALGALVVNNLPALIKSTSSVIDEIGFGLMGIITNVDNKRIAIIHNKKGFIQKNINPIVDKAYVFAKRINAMFERILNKNIFYSDDGHAKKDEYAYGLSSTFKVLSYFASMWDLDESDVKKTLDNIPAYYVYDSIAKVWNGHGDTRLFDYYSSNMRRNYLEPIDTETFQTAFKAWIIDNPNVHVKFNDEVRALITIHANLTYLKSGVPTSEDYEFEHVIPRARILKYDAKPNFTHIASLGNGMFLPKKLNNKKSSNTLYEYNIKNPDFDYSSLIKESDYFSKNQFNKIFLELENKQFNQVNELIDKRSEEMAKSIIEGLDARNNVFHRTAPKQDSNKLSRY